MATKNWGLAKNRRDNIRTLREGHEDGPRLPDFFGDPSEEDHNVEENFDDVKPLFEDELPPQNDDYAQPQQQGKIVFTMNKISFLSITFGLLLIGMLLFVAGIMTAYYILPGGPKAIGTAIQGANLPQPPQIQLPTKEDIAKSIEKAVGKLGKAPDKQEVEKAIQSAVKSVTPKFALPTVEKAISSEDSNPEFLDGAKRTPSDSDAGRFTVQAKVYGDGAWAMQLARKLKEEGYGAYMIRVKERHTNRQHYHTRVGVFGDYMAANTLVRKLKEMGNRSATVVLIASGEDRLTP